MEILQWSPKLATGIPEIDNQHRRIVAMVNQMREAMESGDTEAVGRVIPEMVDYTISHFAFEEALMEEAGYRFLMPHQRVHQLFTRRIPEFQARYEAGEDVLEELHTMLVRWLSNHIQGEDQGYVASIKALMAEKSGEASPETAQAQPAASPKKRTAAAHGRPQAAGRRTLWQRIKGLFLVDA